MGALRNGSKDQKSSNIAIMVAMKGKSSNKKTEIANKLAAFLKCPLIDEGDIIEAIETAIPSFSSTEENKDLPFKIITQISSTQLRLKLHVILNAELSQRSHFDHLVRLAGSKGACLVIIDCESENGSAIYDVGNVPKLKIDASKPFIVEEFVPAMLNAANFRQETNQA